MIILARAGWRARPPARGYVNAPSRRPGIEGHHTVGTYGISRQRLLAGDTAVAGELARALQNDHLSRTWTDVFYNALVMPDGLVVVLRPWHAASGSVRHFTVVVPGNTDHTPLTDPQKASIAALRQRYPGDVTWHGARAAVGCPGADYQRFLAAGAPAPDSAPQEDIVASLDDLKDVVAPIKRTVDAIRKDVRTVWDRSNESVRLSQEACRGHIANIRAEVGLEPDPASDEVWVGRLRSGEADLAEVRRRLTKAATKED